MNRDNRLDVKLLHHLLHIQNVSCSFPGELDEDFETSSESTTGPLDRTKDTCNFGAKQLSEETGTAAFTYNTTQSVQIKLNYTALIDALEISVYLHACCKFS